MSKVKNAIFGLSASGSISGGLTYLTRMRQQIVEKTPVIKDAKTTAQLSWRHMFLKVVALWHALSAAEKAEWESNARPRHMTGYAWFVSQALRPNPGIYLPLQGGTMQGIIDMDGYAMQDLLDPVGAQDGDTKAARDAAITAAIGGSLTCDIYGYDGANWQKIKVGTPSDAFVNPPNAMETMSFGMNFDGVKWRRSRCYDGGYNPHYVMLAYGGNVVWVEKTDSDSETTAYYALRTESFLYGFDGSAWDRLRTYGTGILKVGRAEIGLSDLRRTGVGQVKAAAGQLYWIVLNPSAGNSLFELTDDLNGLGAVVLDHFDTNRDGHMMTFDPPMEFSTGIYLKTLTNLTSIIFGYK